VKLISIIISLLWIYLCWSQSA